MKDILSDINEGIRHLQVSLFGSLCDFPVLRFQIDEDLYIRLLKDPIDAKCNVILLRGGVFHMSGDASYVKMAVYNFDNCRVFQMEKYSPLLNYSYAAELSKLIKFVKKNYPGQPVYVMGFSMGGIFILSYLAMGFDEADGYITISAPINFDYFQSVINDHFFYVMHQKKITKMYNKDTIEDVIELFGGDKYFNAEFMQSFTDKLKKHHANFYHKYISIVGTKDRLAKTFLQDCKDFQFPLATIEVEGGTHCCTETILYACACMNSWANDSQVHSYKTINDVANNYTLNRFLRKQN